MIVRARARRWWVCDAARAARAAAVLVLSVWVWWCSMQPAARSGRQRQRPPGRVGPCGSRSTAPAGSAAISGDGWPGPRDGRGRVHLRRDQRAGRDRAHRRADHLTFGELDGRRTERAQRLLACYQQAGVAAELSPAIKTVLWAKLAFICAQAGMTAAVRLPIGEIRTVDAAWAAFQRLVAEVAAVAEADGTPVPPAALERALTLAQGVEPGSFSSLHDDLVAGRRMELEALHGFVVRRAAEHGVPVPTSQAIYAILKPWAVRNERTER